MKIKLNVDYKRKEEESREVSNISLSADYINFAINQTHKDGVEGQLKRVVGRLQRKLDDAVINKTEEIDLESAEIDLIKKSFEKVKTPPQLTKYWIILEDEIDLLSK